MSKYNPSWPFHATGRLALALSGIRFAGNQAARVALTNAFSRLYEGEASNEQYEAKKVVYSFGRLIKNADNRYSKARKHFAKLALSKRIELHRARRRLKHFWFLATAYYESHIMSASEIFSICGSPDILHNLEALEILASEEYDKHASASAFPPFELLHEWRKLNKQSSIESF